MPKVGICLFASILLALLIRETISAETASNLELEQLKGEIEAAKNQLTPKVNQDLIDKYFGMDIEFQELLTVAKVHFLLIKYGLKKVMPYEERGFPEKVHLLEGPDQELIALFDETRNRMFFELIFQPKTVEKALHQLELLLRRLLILNNAWEKRRVAQQQAVANNANSVFVVRWLKWIGELVLKWDQQPAVRRNGKIYCERQFRHFGAGEEMCELIYHLKKALKAGAEVYEESEQMMSAEEKQELKLYTGLFWMQSVVNVGIDLREVIKAHKNGKEHTSDKGEASSIKLKESAQTVKRMVRIWLGQEAKISMKLAAAAEGQTTQKLRDNFAEENMTTTSLKWQLLSQVGKLLNDGYDSLLSGANKEEEISGTAFMGIEEMPAELETNSTGGGAGGQEQPHSLQDKNL